jgi:hypothetical protein
MKTTSKSVPRVRRTVKSATPRIYFYIYAKSYKGRPFLDRTDCTTKEEARKLAFRKLKGVVWEIIESTSRDTSAVMANIRHHRLMDNGDHMGDPDYAFQRMRHKL